MTTWKYFRQFQLREALEHVAAGGIAIHESGRIVAGKGTAHLLAGGKRQLMNAAEEIGVKAKHVHISPYDHFDLFGLRQVTLFALGRKYTSPTFQVSAFYRFVRLLAACVREAAAVPA